jgi:hypothetical protein
MKIRCTCGCNFWLLLYAHRHRSILGAAGHIILTPAIQLMVMGLKYGRGVNLSKLGKRWFESRSFKRMSVDRSQQPQPPPAVEGLPWKTNR